MSYLPVDNALPELHADEHHGQVLVHLARLLEREHLEELVERAHAPRRHDECLAVVRHPELPVSLISNTFHTGERLGRTNLVKK